MAKENSEIKNKKIAVIGGGVFGCTAAITLAREGFSVDLFEQSGDIMQAASGINQFRMHRGYHYPRSKETITSCRDATPEFEDEYKDAIMTDYEQHYCIAKEKSLLTGSQYLEVLNEHELLYSTETPEYINHDAIDVTIKVQENLYNPHVLKEILQERLEAHGVTLHLGKKVSVSDLDSYDFVVVATYAASNSVFGKQEELKTEYQFEVCEKIVVEIPSGMEDVSVVVMDGPFTCFDPLGKTGYAVMGHVEHAIHHRSFGYEPEIPEKIKPYLNKGVIKNPVVSNAQKFLEAASYFMPLVKNAKHIGSMYTIRTVLPRVDDTDTRPTIVNAIDDRVITIYSGKVGNSVRAAKDVLSFIKNRTD